MPSAVGTYWMNCRAKSENQHSSTELSRLRTLRKVDSLINLRSLTMLGIERRESFLASFLSSEWVKREKAKETDRSRDRDRDRDRERERKRDFSGNPSNEVDVFVQDDVKVYTIVVSYPSSPWGCGWGGWGYPSYRRASRVMVGVVGNERIRW